MMKKPRPRRSYIVTPSYIESLLRNEFKGDKTASPIRADESIVDVKVRRNYDMTFVELVFERSD